MPVILPEGIRVPDGSDSYDLTNDLRKMMESAFTIVPVANTTARAALVSALVAAGRGPTSARPLYVDRADAPVGLRLEVTYNGTAWSPYTAGDTGWVPCVNASGFNATGLFLRKVGIQVHVRGAVAPTGSGTLPATFVSIANIPAGFRVSTYTQALHPGQSNTTYPVIFQINPVAGVIQARVAATGAYTTNSAFAPAGWLDAD